MRITNISLEHSGVQWELLSVPRSLNRPTHTSLLGLFSMTAVKLVTHFFWRKKKLSLFNLVGMWLEMVLHLSVFWWIFLARLRSALRGKYNTAYENYFRIFVPEGLFVKSEHREPLKVNVLFQHIQYMLSSETAVIAETLDSWFNCQKLKLLKGCR